MGVPVEPGPARTGGLNGHLYDTEHIHCSKIVTMQPARTERPGVSG